SYTPVTDAGLDALRAFPALTRVVLVRTAVTAGGVMRLMADKPAWSIASSHAGAVERAAEDWVFEVGGRVTVAAPGGYSVATAPGLTDDGAAAFATLPKLRRLTLTSTRVTGIGLAALSGSKLEDLRLDGAPADDIGVKAIGTIRSLGGLGLLRTPAVTDAGVA